MAEMFLEPAAAESVLSEAVELAIAAGDDWGQVEALQVLAYSHLLRADHRAVGAWDAGIRADVAARSGNLAEACALGRIRLDLTLHIGEPVSATGAFLPLVRALCALGRINEATQTQPRRLHHR